MANVNRLVWAEGLWVTLLAAQPTSALENSRLRTVRLRVAVRCVRNIDLRFVAGVSNIPFFATVVALPGELTGLRAIGLAVAVMIHN